MSKRSNEKKKKAAKQVEFAKLDHKVAALWTRVSSEKQEQNNCSLETQDKVCKEYAERNGITIKRCFGGTHESAKKMGVEFKKMIDAVTRDKEINVCDFYTKGDSQRFDNRLAITNPPRLVYANCAVSHR